MKKIALVLIVLLIAATSAFAVDAFVYAEVDTYVSYDLGTKAAELSVNPFALVQFKFGKDVATEAEDGVYGSFSVKSVEANYRDMIFSNGTDWSGDNSFTAGKDHWSEKIKFDARINFGPGYLKIDGDETIRARNSSLSNVVDNFSTIGIDHYGTFTSASVDSAVAAGYSLEGIADFEVEFGYKAPVAAVPASTTYELSSTDGLTTTYTAVDTAAVAGSDAAAAMDVAVSVTAVEGLTFDANFVMGFFYPSVDPGFAVLGGYDLALGDMTLMPFVAFDAVLGDEVNFDIGGGVKVKWDSDKSGLVDSGDMKDFFGSERMVSAGATLAGEYTAAGAFNMKLSAAYMPVENLNSVVVLELADVANFDIDSTLGLGVYADYTIGDIVPYGFYSYGTTIPMRIGCSYNGISNTELYVEYNAEDMRTTLDGAISVGACISGVSM